MQCQVRGMADVAEGAQQVDTLPKPGRVNEVCREWLVKEDGALAYRLQSEEIEHHLSGNRWRNAVVREDFPRARDEQRREQELAEEMRRRQAMEQEEYDARVAAELAERMEREEAAKRAALETQDQHVAWRLQEREKQRLGPPQSPTPPLQLLQPVLDPDPNCVGLPPPPDDLSARMRVLRIQGAGRAENPMPRSPKGLPRSTENLADVDAIEDYVEDEEPGDTDALDEEEARRIQEEKDAELARMLQEREAAEADPRRHLSDLDRDRLMAIEAQDRELARLLQERERAKARRAKERARQRAALKRQQQLAAEADAILPAPPTPLSPSPPPVPAVRPTDLDVSPVYRHPGTRSDSGLQAGYQYPAEEEEEPHGYRGSPNNSMSPTNIAAAIDPTYRRGSAHSPSLIECVDLESPPSPALPYMPIQGQRRCPPQPDKRASRKEQQAGKRDACRQQ
ncbi:coiled-coil domain-containing protein 50 isoform X3 [Schistocerca cancellata]|uniref:coiled-coil domain-containing protein 50 isoform X3 n=1 Tax=Schistocerca cancellata TaxID=274614 RepID=UPI0021173717|nr:coiled-coil domain-containing protein 50 isoform X3 [Schistocerca cancellata]